MRSAAGDQIHCGKEERLLEEWVSLTFHFSSTKMSEPCKGPVAQLGARINRTDEVAGSNPARSTWLTGGNKPSRICINFRAHGAAGSASQWH